MTDFIDVLEQQLVTAHQRRPRRLAVPWRASVVLVGTVAAAAVVIALVLALASPTTQHAARPPASHRTANPPTPTPRARVALAVLNGTTLTGLARDAANELVANGCLAPNVVTNDTTNQSRRHSEVFYEPGHKGDAQGVAGCLHIGFDRVQPMDANARALADRADVAVFLGYDRAK